MNEAENVTVVEPEAAPEFAVGDVVWAKLEGHPWWPSLVCEHPQEKTHYKAGRINKFHVIFYDKPPTRAWVKEKFIKRYDGSRCPEFQKGAQFYSAALAQSAALHGADTALRVTRDERLQFKEGWETGLPWRDEADLLDDLVDLDRAAAQPRARASRRKADDNSVSMETDLSPGSVGAASSNSKLPNGDEPQSSIDAGEVDNAHNGHENKQLLHRSSTDDEDKLVMDLGQSERVECDDKAEVKKTEIKVKKEPEDQASQDQSAIPDDGTCRRMQDLGYSLEQCTCSAATTALSGQPHYHCPACQDFSPVMEQLDLLRHLLHIHSVVDGKTYAICPVCQAYSACAGDFANHTLQQHSCLSKEDRENIAEQLVNLGREDLAKNFRLRARSTQQSSKRAASNAVSPVRRSGRAPKPISKLYEPEDFGGSGGGGGSNGAGSGSRHAAAQRTTVHQSACKCDVLDTPGKSHYHCLVLGCSYVSPHNSHDVLKHLKSVHKDARGDPVAAAPSTSSTLMTGAAKNSHFDVRTLREAGHQLLVCKCAREGGSDHYHCPECNLPIKKKNGLSMHLLKNHRITVQDDYYVCPACSELFAYAMNLAKHIRKHKVKQEWNGDWEENVTSQLLATGQEDILDKTWQRKDALLKACSCDQAGANLGQGNIHYHCPLSGCAYVSINGNAGVWQHVRSAHKETYYRCLACDLQFVEEVTFEDHIMAHTEKGELTDAQRKKMEQDLYGKKSPNKKASGKPCGTPPEFFARYGVQQLRESGMQLLICKCPELGEQGDHFHCPCCQTAIKKRHVIVIHLLREHKICVEDDFFACPSCEHLFAYAAHLLKHITGHKVRKEWSPHQESDVTAQFMRTDNSKLVPNGWNSEDAKQSRQIAQFCDCDAITDGRLHMHCPITGCSYIATKVKSTLYRHLREVHRETYFPCVACKERFIDVTEFNDHIANHCSRGNIHPYQRAKMEAMLAAGENAGPIPIDIKQEDMEADAEYQSISSVSSMLEMDQSSQASPASILLSPIATKVDLAQLGVTSFKDTGHKLLVCKCGTPKSDHFHCPIGGPTGECNSNSTKKDHIVHHLLREHRVAVNEDIFHCPLCREIFAYGHYLAKHVRKHKTKQEWSAAMEEVVTAQLLSTGNQEVLNRTWARKDTLARACSCDLVSTSNSGMANIHFHCPIEGCAYTCTRTSSGVHNHLASVHKDTYFTCLKCKQHFVDREIFSAHIKQHAKKREITAADEAKMREQLTQAEQKAVVQAQVQQHQCTTALADNDAAREQRDRFGISTLKESGMQLLVCKCNDNGHDQDHFHCPVCNVSIKMRHAMSTHLLREHKVATHDHVFCCPVCKLLFSYGCNLVKHVQRHKVRKDWSRVHEQEVRAQLQRAGNDDMIQTLERGDCKVSEKRAVAEFCDCENGPEPGVIHIHCPIEGCYYMASKDKGLMYRHLLVIHKEQYYPCSACKDRFIDSNEFLAHVENHLATGNLSAAQVAKLEEQLQRLETDYEPPRASATPGQRVAKAATLPTDQNQRLYERYGVRSLQETGKQLLICKCREQGSEDDHFHCPECNVAIKMRHAMINHLLREHKVSVHDNFFSCPVCDLLFAYAFGVMKHIQGHKVRKLWSSEHEASLRAQLDQAGESEVLTSPASRNAQQSRALAKFCKCSSVSPPGHLHLHCPIDGCSYTANKTPGLVYRHLREVHKESYFPCIACRERFIDRSEYCNHILDHFARCDVNDDVRRKMETQLTQYETDGYDGDVPVTSNGNASGATWSIKAEPLDEQAAWDLETGIIQPDGTVTTTDPDDLDFTGAGAERNRVYNVRTLKETGLQLLVCKCSHHVGGEDHFHCPVEDCDVSIKMRHAMCTHLLREHRISVQDNFFTCPVCDFISAYPMNLMKHIVGHKSRRQWDSVHENDVNQQMTKSGNHELLSRDWGKEDARQKKALSKPCSCENVADLRPGKVHHHCPIDGCSYVSYHGTGSIYLHMEGVHRETYFPCCVCSQRFVDVALFECHVRDHDNAGQLSEKNRRKTEAMINRARQQNEMDDMGVKREPLELSALSSPEPGCARTLNELGLQILTCNCMLNGGANHYHCPVCNELHKTKTYCARHLIKEHQISAEDHYFSCPICNKLFIYQYDVTKHIKAHKAKKEWTRVAQRNVTAQFLRAKNNTAPVLDKAAASKDDDSFHSTDFVCQVEEREPDEEEADYNDDDAMDNNAAAAHICDVCNTMFSSASILEAHMKSHVTKVEPVVDVSAMKTKVTPPAKVTKFVSPRNTPGRVTPVVATNGDVSSNMVMCRCPSMNRGHYHCTNSACNVRHNALSRMVNHIKRCTGGSVSSSSSSPMSIEIPAMPTLRPAPVSPGVAVIESRNDVTVRGAPTLSPNPRLSENSASKFVLKPCYCSAKKGQHYHCSEPQCPYASTQGELVRKHVKKHDAAADDASSGVKCPRCSILFESTPGLNSHLLMHERERPLTNEEKALLKSNKVFKNLRQSKGDWNTCSELKEDLIALSPAEVTQRVTQLLEVEQRKGEADRKQFSWCSCTKTNEQWDHLHCPYTPCRFVHSTLPALRRHVLFHEEAANMPHFTCPVCDLHTEVPGAFAGHVTTHIDGMTDAEKMTVRSQLSDAGHARLIPQIGLNASSPVAAPKRAITAEAKANKRRRLEDIVKGINSVTANKPATAIAIESLETQAPSPYSDEGATHSPVGAEKRKSGVDRPGRKRPRLAIETVLDDVEVLSDGSADPDILEDDNDPLAAIRRRVAAREMGSSLSPTGSTSQVSPRSPAAASISPRSAGAGHSPRSAVASNASPRGGARSPGAAGQSPRRASENTSQSPRKTTDNTNSQSPRKTADNTNSQSPRRMSASTDQTSPRHTSGIQDIDQVENEKLWQHLEKSKKGVVHFCVCGMVFDDQTMYFLHRSLHNSENSRKCQMCVNEFENWPAFIAHLHVHPET